MAELGATNFDKLCHKLFAARDNGVDYRGRDTGVKCNHCGNELVAYYCESRLYMVSCRHCKTRALVMATSRKDAAEKTFGRKEDRAMAECKWMKDEICVNADCPMCADYCPVANDPGVCRYEDREDGEQDG